jgi:hypothetical protein
MRDLSRGLEEKEETEKENRKFCHFPFYPFLISVFGLFFALYVFIREKENRKVSYIRARERKMGYFGGIYMVNALLYARARGFPFFFMRGFDGFVRFFEVVRGILGNSQKFPFLFCCGVCNF